MPERPLLLLPSATVSTRARRPPPREEVRIPSRDRQVARLGQRFERLAGALDRPGGLAALQADPESIAPDRAVVFELASSLTDFYAAAARVPGLELLAEEEREVTPDEDFVLKDSRGRERFDRAFTGRLYFAM